ncbi:MAG: hypothetical protein JXR14_13210 [Paracoccaceae bacterium]
MRLSMTTAFLVLMAAPAAANDFAPAMQEYMDSQLVAWANDPLLVDAIVAQNAKTAGYDAAMLETLDQQWRAEVGTSPAPTITPVLEHSAADFLREQVEASEGVIQEVFIMDAKGLNVAASHATSDMWQGDEAKFSETFGNGAGSVHFSEIEFDESTQQYQGQISMTIVDPASGAPVGAITVGIDAEALM